MLTNSDTKKRPDVRSTTCITYIQSITILTAGTWAFQGQGSGALSFDCLGLSSECLASSAFSWVECSAPYFDHLNLSNEYILMFFYFVELINISKYSKSLLDIEAVIRSHINSNGILFIAAVCIVFSNNRLYSLIDQSE